MGVTITQVARAAGVSVATVSRALNDKGPVKAATRRRVQAAAQRLGYVPHGGARSLITRRTDTLGVLLPDLYGGFFSEVLRGLDVTARRAGYHLLISSSHSDRDEIGGVLRTMRGRVDGLVVMSPALDGRTLQANLPDGQPVVLLNCRVTGSRCDAINVDNRTGTESLVRHLARLGHRRLAMVCGPPGNYDAQQRQSAFRRAAAALGLAGGTPAEIPGDFGEESGYQAARRALALRPRPTALFAANDAMAVGALSALREAGVDVPGEMALAGFDDIPMARFTTPPLTTVHVELSELGARAAARMVELLRGRPGRRRHELLPTRLVVRASCGAPAESRAASGAAPDGRPRGQPAALRKRG